MQYVLSNLTQLIKKNCVNWEGARSDHGMDTEGMGPAVYAGRSCLLTILCDERLGKQRRLEVQQTLHNHNHNTCQAHSGKEEEAGNCNHSNKLDHP